MLLFNLVDIFLSLSFFFFNDTATTEIYTLSLHDALPIFTGQIGCREFLALDLPARQTIMEPWRHLPRPILDRKSTRLNSSHVSISYAVFCLKKKKEEFLSLVT